MYFVVHAPAEGGVLERTIDRLSCARRKRSAIIRARVLSPALFCTKSPGSFVYEAE